MSNTDNEHDNQQKNNLGSLAEDIGHPFDQTNGVVEGLEGNADDPEVAGEHLDGHTGDSGVEFAPFNRGFIAPGNAEDPENPIREERNEEEAP